MLPIMDSAQFEVAHINRNVSSDTQVGINPCHNLLRCLRQDVICSPSVSSVYAYLR